MRPGHPRLNIYNCDGLLDWYALNKANFALDPAALPSLMRNSPGGAEAFGPSWCLAAVARRACAAWSAAVLQRDRTSLVTPIIRTKFAHQHQGLLGASK